MRFSTIFFANQLVDLFAYELPTAFINLTVETISDYQKNFKNNLNNVLTKNSNSIVVYNFHNLAFQERFFVFAADLVSNCVNFTINSISELFPNASWLERELSELHGLLFTNKKDTRNLMLQYGDISAPFRKSSPSIGLRELFYDSINDKVINVSLNIQV